MWFISCALNGGLRDGEPETIGLVDGEDGKDGDKVSFAVIASFSESKQERSFSGGRV